MTETINIRLATDNDLEAILKIWLDGIDKSFDISTVDMDLVIEKFKINFSNRFGSFNFWVAVDSSDSVIGWQSLIKCFDHPLKENIYAESSTYIAVETRIKGIGELLLNHAIKEAGKSGINFLVGFVATNNTAAKKITRATGWVEIGLMPAGNTSLAKHFLIRAI
jgi:L-amino acid N-acyltransferase YncA